jgi:hypothetical protein
MEASLDGKSELRWHSGLGKPLPDVARNYHSARTESSTLIVKSNAAVPELTQSGLEPPLRQPRGPRRNYAPRDKMRRAQSVS